MACEFTALDQTVYLNTPVKFQDSIPCRRGLVYHDNGEGIFQLRGLNRIARCRCGCSMGRTTDYRLTFTGNIAIPTGGTVGPIAVAFAVGGEPLGLSRSIVTPAAVDEYGNVTVDKIVKIPWGCCPSVSVEYVNGSVDDPAFVPTPAINLNGKLTISLNDD